jgi:uncharacterized protein YdeI (YjbR/CyaY-like superfamily)
MARSAPHPVVEKVLAKPQAWLSEMQLLREIARDTGLEETFKWGWPCYALAGQNVVLIHAFKDYCAYLLFKGSLMADPENLLIQQTENVIGRRQMRFTSLAEIKDRTPVIRAYLDEAIRVEQSGAEVVFRKTDEFPMPAEFSQALDADGALRAAFEGLTPGRQRGYLLFFAAPKLEKTRVARVEKMIPRIMDGLGLDD